MELLLIRNYHENGTNGVLLYRNHFLCYTIELPWRDNKRHISCIPEGIYPLKLRTSKRHKRHLILQSVSGRSLILVHTANNAQKELRGCIAPVSRLTGDGRGIESREALRRILRLLLPMLGAGIPVHLIIKSLKNEKNPTAGEFANTEVFQNA